MRFKYFAVRSRNISLFSLAVSQYRHPSHQKRGVMQTIVQTVLHIGLRYCQAETTDSTLGRLLNREPYTVEDYVRDHSHFWA